MNKEQYIKTVLKNLGCSKLQKNKIKVDLQNDIDTALKMGDSLENIFKRMGTPEELAQEFNENLGVMKKKSHMKVIVGIGIGIVCLLIVGFFYIRSLIPETNPIGTSGLYQESQLQEWALQTIQKQADYQQLYDMSSADMQKQFTKEKWQNAQKTLGELGMFEKITSQYYVEVTQNKEVMAVGEVVGLFEKRSVTFTLTFNEKGQLAGYYVK